LLLIVPFVVPSPYLCAFQTPIDSTEAQAIEEVNLAYENVKEVDCLDISKEGNDAWESAMKR